MPEQLRLQLDLHRGHRIDWSRISDKSVIIDAGVCEGGFSNFLLGKNRGYRLIGIEAAPYNYAKLLKKKGLMEKVEMHLAALVGQGSPDKVVFYGYGMGRGSITPRHDDKNLDSGGWKPKAAGNRHEIDAIRINDIFDYFEIKSNVDYLKMDIEGAEHDIFATMYPETAERIKQFSMEYHALPNTHMDHTLRVLLRNAVDLGFHIQQFPYHGEIYGWRD